MGVGVPAYPSQDAWIQQGPRIWQWKWDVHFPAGHSNIFQQCGLAIGNGTCFWKHMRRNAMVASGGTSCFWVFEHHHALTHLQALVHSFESNEGCEAALPFLASNREYFKCQIHFALMGHTNSQKRVVTRCSCSNLNYPTCTGFSDPLVGLFKASPQVLQMPAAHNLHLIYAANEWTLQAQGSSHFHNLKLHFTMICNTLYLLNVALTAIALYWLALDCSCWGFTYIPSVWIPTSCIILCEAEHLWAA